MNKITLLFITLLTLASSGCSSIATNLERNLNDPGIWTQIQGITDNYSARQQEIRTGNYGNTYEEIDLTGKWQLVGHHNRVNRIRHTYDGIMVTPNTGKPVFYSKIGPNLYRYKGMTYEFTTIHNGEWRSNNKHNKVIQLRRLNWG